MSYLFSLTAYLGAGILGGVFGSKLKVPAGTLVCAMAAVVLLKLVFQRTWPLPRNFDFMVQVIIGIAVGVTFQPKMLKVLPQLSAAIIISTIVLAGTGILIALILNRMGLLDMGSAYLCTSPGAMSAIVGLAIDSNANSTLVISFHFFRVLFVVLTAPFILRYFVS